MEMNFKNEKTGLRRVGNSLNKKKIASYSIGILQTMITEKKTIPSLHPDHDNVKEFDSQLFPI